MVKLVTGRNAKPSSLGVRTVGRHGDLAEGIDVGLDNDICKTDHGVLHTGRKTVADDLAEHFAVDMQLFQLDLIDRTLLHQMDHAQDHADSLRDEIVVATAAAHTPQWNAPINSRSSTILVRDEMIR